MLKEKSIIIGENEYTFYQFSATEGTITLLELSKLLGTPLGVLADGIKNAIANSGANKLTEVLDSNSKDLLKVISGISISEVVTSLVKNIEVNETMKLIKTLLKKVKVKLNDGSYVTVSEIFETHFQGEYVLLFRLIKESIEFQYGSFFLLFQNIKKVG